MKLWLTIILICYTIIFAQTGNVYLVLGSDTAIWDGLNDNTYRNYYNQQLYSDVTANAYKVMAATFRNNLRDSYGTPMKLTWWMMGGNMYRAGINNNVPCCNTITIHVMKKYHFNSILSFGDELSLHYHTFKWSDYNNDGKYYWNQTDTFMECKDDFDYTLAQYLIEENTFPVSYRSGWHYKDNGWQNYLEELFPYSMDNDYPSKYKGTTEPVYGTEDWSKAPSTWVPYHPSATNYQVPGNLKGYNVRSKHIGNISQSEVDSMFARAKRGIDQVACLWGHLPETDFLDNLKRVDSLAHISAAKFPVVKFKYCSAVEAMQLWRKTTDTTPPQCNITLLYEGENVRFQIYTNENLFMSAPFFCGKDINENYFTIPLNKSNNTSWISARLYKTDDLVKVGAALIDTSGNLTTAFKNFLPEDIFIDDADPGCIKLNGNWNTVSDYSSWSGKSINSTSDSASLQININPAKTQNYNLFIQFPETSTKAAKIQFGLYNNQTLIADAEINTPYKSKEWLFIKNVLLDSSKSYKLLIKSPKESALRTLSFDVIRITPIIPKKKVLFSSDFIEFPNTVIGDTAKFSLIVKNAGSESLKINNSTCSDSNLTIKNNFPVIIPPNGESSLILNYRTTKKGVLSDSMQFIFENGIPASVNIRYNITVENYYRIVDNEDSTCYTEKGVWAKSVAQAYGISSRYSPLPNGTGATASFSTLLRETGKYLISFIVPKTVNSSDKAFYKLLIDGIMVDSVYINQNTNSGNWLPLFTRSISNGRAVTVQVINDGKYSAGDVLRADAVKFQIVEETSDIAINFQNEINTFELYQNFPNPFNPVTTIQFNIPENCFIELSVFNSIGQKVKVLYSGQMEKGNYKTEWNATNIPAGIYFYELRTNTFREVKKMLLLK